MLVSFDSCREQIRKAYFMDAAATVAMLREGGGHELQLKCTSDELADIGSECAYATHVYHVSWGSVVCAVEAAQATLRAITAKRAVYEVRTAASRCFTHAWLMWCDALLGSESCVRQWEGSAKTLRRRGRTLRSRCSTHEGKWTRRSWPSWAPAAVAAA